LIAIALLAFAPMMQAQTTTGNIAGTVSASGEALARRDHRSRARSDRNALRHGQRRERPLH
jgi:hypothetical protein